MDISDFPTIKETSSLIIRNPATQEPMFEVELFGPDTDRYRKAQIAVVRGGKGKKPSDDDIMVQQARLLAKITHSWDNLTMGDKPFECSEDNAFMIYRDFKYIADQVDLFISNRLNFLELA